MNILISDFHKEMMAIFNELFHDLFSKKSDENTLYIIPAAAHLTIT